LRVHRVTHAKRGLICLIWPGQRGWRFTLQSVLVRQPASAPSREPAVCGMMALPCQMVSSNGPNSLYKANHGRIPLRQIIDYLHEC
jgi:hypothetical protein